MQLVGFGNFDWTADGFWYDIPTPFVPTVSIEPSVIPRPGTFATYGMSTIGGIYVAGSFGYSGTAMVIEEAFRYLLTRLNPLDQSARQLRALDYANTLIAIQSKLRVPAQADEEFDGTYKLHFVSVDPYWETLTPQTISVTF